MELMIRILIVDDNQLMRRGLRSLLTRDEGIEVVGEARNSQEALTLAEKLSPEIVLLDINMPGQDGLETVEQLRALASKPRVLIVSMHADGRLVHEALRRGARGYVIKQDCFTELVPAIREVFQGNLYTSPALPDFKDDGKSRR